MSVLYTRVSDINEKVKDASLTITQWRVLFSINESTSVEEIKEYVDDELDQIKGALDALLEEHLIETDSETEDVAIDESADVPIIEEAEPEVVSIEEDHVEEEAVEAPEIDMDDVEEEVVFEEETTDEIIIEEDDVEIETSEDDIIIDDVEIEAEVVEEDIIIEEESIEIEEEDIILEETEEVSEDISVEEDVLIEEEPEIVEESVAIEEDVIEDTPEEPAAPTSSGNSKKIMVIDESIVIRKMVEIAFEDLEFEIIGHPSGEAALENATQDNADVYLIDSALKDIKSVDLMSQIKAKKDAPVIMFCTKTNPQLAKEVEAAGCDGIVSKPFNDEDLINKVNELT